MVCTADVSFAPGDPGSVVVDADPGSLDDGTETPDGVLLHAETPMPTASAPTAANTLRTMRG